MEEFNDVESQLEHEPAAEPGPGIPWGGLTTIVGIALIVLFAVQNTEPAEVEFLWWSGQFPLAMVILVTALVAVLFTVAARAFYRRRRLKRRAERAALKQLRGED